MFGEGKIKDDREMKNKYGQDEVEEDYLIMNRVFNEMKKCESISILQTRKANGECAHVSFVRFKETYTNNQGRVMTETIRNS